MFCFLFNDSLFVIGGKLRFFLVVLGVRGLEFEIRGRYLRLVVFLKGYVEGIVRNVWSFILVIWKGKVGCGFGV